MDKSHKDLDVIDTEAPRHAQYLHNAWKRHQDAENWVDINLAFEKGLTFYQTRSNAIILQETLPAYCIPKVVRMETGEVLCEKVYMSGRLDIRDDARSVQDGRKTSRSQEIDVNSFHE